MNLYTLYMIVNCASWSLALKYTLHMMPVLMRYTNQVTTEQDVIVLEQTMWLQSTSRN